MGTRSMVSGPHSKSAPDRRMGFGHLEVKKEFRIKKETPDDEIKEYAETAMNELLGWYGYDKVDSRDTQGLNLHHFAANKMTSARRSPSDADSSDAEGPKVVGSPGKREGTTRESPSLPEQAGTPAGCIICSWCNKIVSHKMFSLKTPGGEKSFCSEMCFSQCRRANFKRNKTCDWCRHIRHTVNYVDFQDGEHQLQFCSDKCLNQYKMNIFCKETEAHLQLHPHLQGLGSGGAGGGSGGGANASLRLITPELWMRDCRSESPLSDRSTSPNDTPTSPTDIKLLPRPSPDTPQLPPKPPPQTSLDKREKSRKTHVIGKSRRHTRCSAAVAERRSSSSSSSPRSGESPLTPPKPPSLFPPPPLLPLNPPEPPHPPPPPPPPPPLLRPPFLPLPLPCFPPSSSSPLPSLHRNPLSYDQILRPPLISPPSPSNPRLQPPPPPPLPPPRSLLPPVTVLVPYPIPLALPIPLPIPIPIPLPLSLLPPKDTPPPEKTPPSPPSPPPPPPLPPPPQQQPQQPSSPSSVPRPPRKRKRLPDAAPSEDDDANKRKTVPV